MILIPGRVATEFCFACGEIGDLKLSEEGLVRVNPPEKVDVLVK